MAPSRKNDPIGIYIHVPFCSHICPYCDFNTYRGQEARIPAYVDAMTQQLKNDSSRLRDRAVGSVYFGGGTPSLLESDQVARMLSTTRSSFDLLPDTEISLESNPNSVDERYFHGLLDAGVTRLSIGAQTFDRRGLRVLGRQHEAHDIENAARSAKSAGFGNVSIDLIYGWPEQTLESWRQDIYRFLELDIEHLSAYSLIVEPGTPMFEAVERRVMQPADEDLSADMYEELIDRMEQVGWQHYEISNWAKQPELQSRHNALYWRNSEYLGVGAGAYGRIGSERVMNHLLPATYIESIAKTGTAASNAETISQTTSMGETMMLGLRLLEEGIASHDFASRYGVEIDFVYGGRIERLIEQGLLQRKNGSLQLTRHGMMLANEVCAKFV